MNYAIFPICFLPTLSKSPLPTSKNAACGEMYKYMHSFCFQVIAGSGQDVYLIYECFKGMATLKSESFFSPTIGRTVFLFTGFPIIIVMSAFGKEEMKIQISIIQP